MALSEASARDRVDPETNRHHLRRTKRQERPCVPPMALKGAPARAALYAEVLRRKIPGRSRMSKAALLGALLT